MQDPRQLTYKFGVRYEDADKVKKIAEDIKSWFNAHPGVDQKLPAKVSLADLGPYSLTLSVMVSKWMCEGLSPTIGLRDLSIEPETTAGTRHNPSYAVEQKGYLLVVFSVQMPDSGCELETRLLLITLQQT